MQTRIFDDSRENGRGPVDAVLFDLDGTILDTTEVIIASLKHTVEHFTGRVPSYRELRPYMGLPLADVFGQLLPGHVDKACQVYVAHNLAVHEKMVRPYPGACETIEILRSRGVKRAIVTSKRRPAVNLGLRTAGLVDAFDAVVSCGDTPKSKPEPEPVLLAVDLLGLNKDAGELIFVGDSPWDVRAAKSAAALLPGLRVRTAAVTYGISTREDLERERPDHILDDIREVLTLARSVP